MAQTQIRTPGIANGAVTVAKLDSSIVGALVPIGGIIMWSGTTIPTGWALCNGSNGTPNLVDKFIVGAGSGYAVAETGGSADATLVSHGHTASSNSTVTDPGHRHFTNGQSAQQGVLQPTGNGSIENGPRTSLSFTGITVSTSTTISTAGSSAINANLPPYYALAFIMKIS